MKKLSCLALVAALIFPAAGIRAQVVDNSAFAGNHDEVQSEDAALPKKYKELKYGVCNHLGIGISAGLMDGATVNAGLPLGPNIAVRGGYNVIDYIYSFKKSFDFGEFVAKRDGGATENWNLDDIPVEASFKIQYFGVLDIYPGKTGSFHFTVGVVGGDGELFHATADLRGVEQITEDDYAKTSISYNDFSASTDEKGFVHIGVRAKNKIMPYLGIGFGRICNIKSRVSLSLDLGVVKTGGIQVFARDYYNKADSYVTSTTVDHEDKIGKYEDLIDKAAEGKLPVLKDFLPCIKIGLNVRLF